MLDICIIYLPGTGGNLLLRTLTLDEDTVALVKEDLCKQQSTIRLSSCKRLQMYNNWNAGDWTQAEMEVQIWYHHGLTDFVDYEKTDLKFIDCMHPGMFEYENTQKILWRDQSAWQHLVLIEWDLSDLDLIKRLAVAKRPNYNHKLQIELNEIESYNRLKKIPGLHSIHWKNMLQLTSYIDNIEKLSKKLNLKLDLDMVEQLWKKWKVETDKLL